jgi:molecular chaperone GrpE
MVRVKVNQGGADGQVLSTLEDETYAGHENPGVCHENPGDKVAALYKDRWLRSRAELDNLQKRTASKIAAQQEAERDKLLREFLVIADSLERALDHSTRTDNPWHEGMEIMQRQMMDLLDRYEVEAIGRAGDDFDPHFHEAVACEVRPDLPAGTISEVMETGYRIRKNKLLRPAKVIIVQHE